MPFAGRGILRCGIGAISEYAWRDDTGRMEGFRVDLCRAVAAAVLDARDAVEFVRPIAAHRLEMLVNGDVDLLIAGVSWTLTREAKAGLSFTTPILYDGQGFVVRRSFGLEQMADLTVPVKVCVVANTTTERNLVSFIKASGLPLTTVVAQHPGWRVECLSVTRLRHGDGRSSVAAARPRGADAAPRGLHGVARHDLPRAADAGGAAR